MASFKKLLLLGGAGAAAAALLLKRDKVAALLPGGSSGDSAPEPWAPAPAGPSNYDAPGPVANTATPVPAPEPETLTDTGAIDEAAEEAAAAAEAANIGGHVADYADDDDPSLVADEADRPVMESGEGYAEGQEQAEAELVSAAEPDPAPGISDFQRQIDDTIEEAGDPHSGEQIEPVAPPDFDTRAEPEEGRTAEPTAADTEPLFPPPETPGVPDTSEPPTEAETAPGLPDQAAADAAAEAVAPDQPTAEWQPPAPPAPPEDAPLADTPPASHQDEEPNAYETFAMPSVSQPELEPEPDPEPEPEAAETPAAEQPAPEEPAPAEEEPKAEEPPKDEPADSGSDWRTWSGRSIDS